MVFGREVLDGLEEGGGVMFLRYTRLASLARYNTTTPGMTVADEPVSDVYVGSDVFRGGFLLE